MSVARLPPPAAAAAAAHPALRSLPAQVKTLSPPISQSGKVAGEVTQIAASPAANQVAVGHADGAVRLAARLPSPPCSLSLPPLPMLLVPDHVPLYVSVVHIADGRYPTCVLADPAVGPGQRRMHSHVCGPPQGGAWAALGWSALCLPHCAPARRHSRIGPAALHSAAPPAAAVS